MGKLPERWKKPQFQIDRMPKNAGNGYFDRQRTPNVGTGAALTTDEDVRSLLWLLVLEMSRVRLGVSIITGQDLADALSTVDLEA